MNHKIRIAISRVDSQESGTGTFTNAQLEGGEFQFTSKDQVKQYLEDARKTMNEDQIKVLLVSLGCESVDDAMTMVANMSDEDVVAKFAEMAAMLKTADQSSTDVNMPMFNIDNMKNQKIDLVNGEADKVKKQIEGFIDQQLDQIKTQDGSSLRDWVHQEGGIQKVLTSTEFKVKQLGYKLMKAVETFVKGLPEAPAEEFVKENGSNIREWLNKLQVSATVKPACECPRRARVAAMKETASFTLKAMDEYQHIQDALKNDQVNEQLEQLLGPGADVLLYNFVYFDASVRKVDIRAALNDEVFGSLCDFMSVMGPHMDSSPALANCKSVIDQLEVLVENEFGGDSSELNNLGETGRSEEATWAGFMDKEDVSDALDVNNVGVFNLEDANGLVSVEWEAALEEPEAMAAKLDMEVSEVIEKAQQLKNLNEMWDAFQDDWEGPHADLEDQLTDLEQQWEQFSQDQVLADLVKVLEVFGVPGATEAV